MTLPPARITNFGQDLYDWIAPEAAHDADHGYVMLTLMGALGEGFRQVEELVRAQPGRQPWQQAFDIDRAPDFQLPWLGQMVGVRVTPNADADSQRAQVRAEAGFNRALVASLISAVAGTLVGSPVSVQVLERVGGDAWAIDVITDPAQTPSTSVTLAAAMKAKDAGLVLTLLQSSTPFWFQGSLTFLAVSDTFLDATLAQVT